MAYPEAIEQIKEKVKTLKLSQVELSNLTGISASYLSRIFSFEREASDQMLVNLAQAVKLPPMQILQQANRVPHEPSDDESIDRIKHLYKLLSVESKARAEDFLEFLLQQEEKQRGKRRKP